MTTNSVFSDRLIAVREERGIKRQKAADDLGITRASLEYYEKGMRKPDTEMLLKICEYYEVSADYLLGLSNAQITATDDEQLKTACDYMGVDELTLKILKLRINDDRTDILYQTGVLFRLSDLLKKKEHYGEEMLKELELAKKASKKNEDAKAKGHIQNYLLLERLSRAIETDIFSLVSHDIFSIVRYNKLFELKDELEIEALIESVNKSGIYTQIKYAGDSE